MVGINGSNPVNQPNLAPIESKSPAKLPSKVEYTYKPIAAPAAPSQSRSILGPAVRLFATFITLGVSENVNKGFKKILAIGLSKALTICPSKEMRQEWLEEFKTDPHYRNSTGLSVKIGEKAQLDGVIIKPNIGGESEKYVIWLNGLGCPFEAKLSLAGDYADTINANILMFNYRGIGDSISSGPTKPEDLVTDTKAMIAYLIDVKGVKPEDIVIHGHSLGGGVGAQAAAEISGLKFINDRSFSAFSKAAKELTIVNFQDKVGKTVAHALGSLVAGLIRGYDLDLKTSKVYELEKNDTLLLYHPNDEIINKSSMKQYLEKHQVTSQNRKPHKFVDLSESNSSYDNAHNDFFLDFNGTAGHIHQFIHGKALVFGVVKPIEPAPEMLTEDMDFLDIENQVDELFNFKKSAADDLNLENLDSIDLGSLNLKSKPIEGEEI